MFLYQSKFLHANYLELQYLSHFYWTEYAEYMDEQGIYHEWLNFLDKRIYKRANQIYTDFRRIEHLISQETIDWFVTYILPKIISHKGYRMGILLHDNSKISVPTTIKVNNIKIETKIFQSPENLMDWLMHNAERKEPGIDDHDHSHDGDTCQHS